MPKRHDHQFDPPGLQRQGLPIFLAATMKAQISRNKRQTTGKPKCQISNSSCAPAFGPLALNFGACSSLVSWALSFPRSVPTDRLADHATMGRVKNNSDPSRSGWSAPQNYRKNREKMLKRTPFGPVPLDWPRYGPERLLDVREFLNHVCHPTNHTRHAVVVEFVGCVVVGVIMWIAEHRRVRNHDGGVPALPE